MNASIKIFDEEEIKSHFRIQYANQYKLSFIYEAVEEALLDSLQAEKHIFDQALLYGSCFNLSKSLNYKTLSSGHLANEYLKNELGKKIEYYEDSVPFGPEEFDLIVSSLLLQFVNNFPEALRKYKLALKKGGIFIASIIGGESFKELREALSIADQQVYGGIFPRVMPMINLDTTSQSMKYAGFTSFVTHSEIIMLNYSRFEDLLCDFNNLGLGNFILSKKIEAHDTQFYKEAEKALWLNFSKNNKIQTTLEIIFCRSF